MNFAVKVRAQRDPKIINGDFIVQTNRSIEIKKKIKDLTIGDSFCYNGVWYDVEDINSSNELSQEELDIVKTVFVEAVFVNVELLSIIDCQIFYRKDNSIKTCHGSGENKQEAAQKAMRILLNLL
jgi:hypothetical protein